MGTQQDNFSMYFTLWSSTLFKLVSTSAFSVQTQQTFLNFSILHITFYVFNFRKYTKVVANVPNLSTFCHENVHQNISIDFVIIYLEIPHFTEFDLVIN